MSSAALRDELSTDPLGRGYSAMTASEIHADLTTAYRTRQKESVEGGELWDRTIYSEFQTLTNAEQDQWLNLCGVATVDPFGPAEDVAVSVFGSGSTTLSQLADFRTEDITRAAELGLASLAPYDVAKAIDQLGGL